MIALPITWYAIHPPWTPMPYDVRSGISTHDNPNNVLLLERDIPKSYHPNIFTGTKPIRPKSDE